MTVDVPDVGLLGIAFVNIYRDFVVGAAESAAPPAEV